MEIDTNILYNNTIKAQKKAASPNLSIWANANAGAGKTKVLIDRIARLLLTKIDPSMILAVTYTKAAAAEMTTRLFDRLGKWAIMPDEDLTKILIELGEDNFGDNPKEYLSRARALFAHALETPGGLKIETIHAFCGNVLKRFPLEAGVAPGFEIIEDATAERLKNIALARAQESAFEEFAYLAKYLDRNSQNIILANAVNYLDEMPNISAKELHDKLLNYFGITAGHTHENIIDDAYNSINKNLIRTVYEILCPSDKIKDNKTSAKLLAILNEEEKLQAVKLVYDLVYGTSSKYKDVQITAKYREYAPVIELFGHKPSDGEEWQLSPILEDILQKAQKIEAYKIVQSSNKLFIAASEYKKIYNEIKSNHAKLDYSDLLKKTSKLLNAEDGAALWVLYKLDQGLAHILIDESQDTSAEQWELLSPLINALETETYKKAMNVPRTLFVVGDEKQSIYSFQGASPSRYLYEQSRFKQRNTADISHYNAVEFNMSFRTGQEILDKVDEVWKSVNENGDLEKKFQLSRHYAYRAKESSNIELWPIKIRAQENVEVRAYDIPFNADIETSPTNQLAEQIALEIKSRIDNKQPIWGKNNKTRPIEPKDIMILVKARKALFHQIIKRLKAHKIPVAGSDKIILTEDAGIMDLIAIGRFIIRPEDDFNFALVLKSAFCGLINDDKYLFTLAYKRGARTLWQKLRESEDEMFKPAKEFLIACLEYGQGKTPFDFYSYILEVMHTNVCAKTDCPINISGQNALLKRYGHEIIEPLDVFIDLCIKAPQNSIASMLEFLDYIEFNSKEQKREFDENNDGVKVMTVHGAKGREAPLVILPDTCRELSKKTTGLYFDSNVKLPLWAHDLDFEIDAIAKLKAIQAQEADDEDNRLFYVAMTRAKDRLIICGAKSGNAKLGYGKNSWYAKFNQAIANDENFSNAPLALIKSSQEPEFAKIWGDALPEAENIVKTDVKNEILIPDWIIKQPPKPNKPLKKMAPSALFGDYPEPVAASPINNGDLQRFLRGRIVHELLENFPLIEKSRREKYAALRLKRESSLSEEARQDIIKEAFNIINHPDFGRFFSENSRAEVSIIGKGKGLSENILINGTIDRLVIDENEVLILDYKTNRPPPTNIDKVPKIYISQMAAYRAVLQETYASHNVRCALLWTDIPSLMEIPPDYMDNEIKYISNKNEDIIL